ncbi:hypothetical protein NQD34_013984 [Periophthalmus magnuspinnatus]|nr:hypothetical protein NQD34_013984 [Periophthalmus magnuspinnatus]
MLVDAAVGGPCGVLAALPLVSLMTTALSSPLPLTAVTMSLGSLLSSDLRILPILSAFSARRSSQNLHDGGTRGQFVSENKRGGVRVKREDDGTDISGVNEQRKHQTLT